MRSIMFASKFSRRIADAIASLAVAIGIIAAPGLEARANDATVIITNGTPFTLTLKSKSVDWPDHARFTWWLDTVPHGGSPVVARAFSDWPWVISPTLVYRIGDTGKTLRIRIRQGSPYPVIEWWCEFPDGPSPIPFGCIGPKEEAINYTAIFYLKPAGTARRR